MGGELSERWCQVKLRPLHVALALGKSSFGGR